MIADNLNQFKRFHRQLMSTAPDGYTPHYFPIVAGGKIPDGLFITKRGNNGSWKADHARLTFTEACNRIEGGSNVALAARANDSLQPADADTEEIYNQFKPSLKTKGRSRIGGHAWYFTDPKDKRLPANIPTGKGEARGCDQYILVPGSRVRCTREELAKKVSDGEITQEQMDKAIADPNLGHYTVENNLAPATIVFEDLPPIFREKVAKDKEIEEQQKALPKYEPRQANGRKSALFDLQITDLVSPRKCNDRFPHPIHDSTTGQNFSISNGLGHCWRCMVSLNAIQFLAVKSGYMTCDQAGTGHKQGGGPSQVKGNNGALFHAWLEAKKIGVIPQNDPVPINAIFYIAEKHELCSPEQIPKRGDFPKRKLPAGIYNKALKTIEEEY